jgi:hypothetical protein
LASFVGGACAAIISAIGCSLIGGIEERCTSLGRAFVAKPIDNGRALDFGD